MELSATQYLVTRRRKAVINVQSSRFSWKFAVYLLWHTPCSIGAQSSKVTHPRSESGGEPTFRAPYLCIRGRLSLPRVSLVPGKATGIRPKAKSWSRKQAAGTRG